MSFWESAVLAGIPTSAVAAGVWQATRDLGLRRRLDGTDRFLEIASLANGRPRDGRSGVGTAEQCAAIELLAAFGKSESHLHAPALAALKETLAALEETLHAVPSDDSVNRRLRSAAEAALGRLEA
jgi:hypothetical protein